MSLPIAAVGAVLAAMLETSVFPELTLFGVQPALVFVLTVVSGMVLGFEEGMVWAFVGGLMLDILLGRPIGATTLTLLIVAGLALLVARVTQPPRILTVVVTVFALSFLYQAFLLVILAVTARVALVSVPIQNLTVVSVLDGIMAAGAAWIIRALALRFGPQERIDW